MSDKPASLQEPSALTSPIRPAPLGPIIGHAYLEGIRITNRQDDYIGRAIIDILEREIATLPAYGPSPRNELTDE